MIRYLMICIICFISQLISACEIDIDISNNNLSISFNDLKYMRRDILTDRGYNPTFEGNSIKLHLENISMRNVTHYTLSVNDFGVLIYLPHFINIDNINNCRLKSGHKFIQQNQYLLIYRKDITAYSNVILFDDIKYSKSNKEILLLIKDIRYYYSEKLFELKNKDVILFITHNNSHYYGNVAGNIIHINVNGLEQVKLAQLLAHEVFHLWNYSESKNRGDMWLHEGSAEYFSIKYLLDRGIIDKNGFRKKLNSDINVCYSSLRNHSINNATFLGNSDIPYFCGSMINYFIEKKSWG